MSDSSRFAAATCEEVWIGGVLAERRFSCGEAVDRGGIIDARDARDEELIRRASELLREMQSAIDSRFRVRLVAEATSDGESSTIILSDGRRSVVSAPRYVDADVSLLTRAAERPAAQPLESLSLPMVWRNGSAAVLLHEAIGHPLEHGLGMPRLPPWLAVDVALARRRASFRDVPLMRMTAVAVMHGGAPCDVPAERIEVHLVEGGTWDPLSDVVSVRVADAERIVDGNALPLEPFTLAAPREAILESIRGAHGAAVRYPGVICSREGQEVVVASSAPTLLTVLR